MTETEMMSHDLTHRYSGNGFAVVEILPPVKSTLTGKLEAHVRVTDKWCQGKQAFLACVDLLEISWLSPGKAPDGTQYPPEPVKLKDDDLKNLIPLREGIADGSLKVINTRFVKQPTTKRTATA